MANGKGFPQCYECSNFILDEKRCKIHRFTFPCISYEVLCRDYIPTHDYSQKSNEGINKLKENCLFYYSYASKPDYIKLGSFEELQQKIYQMELREDKDHIWVLKISDWHEQLKEKGKIEIGYEDKKESFIQKILDEEILPTVSEKNIDYIVSFEKDEQKKELLRKAISPATKKIVHKTKFFVPEDTKSIFLKSFISKNYNLNKYQEIKNKVSYFQIILFLKQINSNLYELKINLYQKEVLK